MRSNEELIDSLVQKGVLKDPNIIKAFREVDRSYFVKEEYKDLSYIDAPLSIGEDQTISQPFTVAFMLELLSAKRGDRVLDIGSGSGYTTALLSKIVGESGEVIALERIDRLIDFAKSNLKRVGIKNFRLLKAKEGSVGLKGELFDRILVSASSDTLPKELLDQLKEGGVIVIPIKDAIYRIIKIDEDSFQEEKYSGFRFVPLIY